MWKNFLGIICLSIQIILFANCSGDEPTPSRPANASSCIKADLNKHLPNSANEFAQGENWPVDIDGGRDLVVKIQSCDKEIPDFLLSSFYTFAEIPAEGGDFTFVFSNDYVERPASLKGVEIITDLDGMNFADKSYDNAVTVVAGTHGNDISDSLKFDFSNGSDSDKDVFGYVSDVTIGTEGTVQTYRFPENRSGKPRVIVVSANHEDTALMQGEKVMRIYKFTFLQY